MTLKLLFAMFVLVIISTGLYHAFKPLPPGVGYRGSEAPLANAKLLTDTTTHNADGSTRLDHEIFDEVFRLIGQANRFVLVDMFLFNDSKPEGVTHRPLARQLTEALVKRKLAEPDIQIIVISDPINTFYGGAPSPWFSRLREAGIQVVETDLTRLRDSNPAWSAWWRVCCQWMGNSANSGWLPNALGGNPATIRSYLALPNFKANHRKLIVVDEGDHLRGLITSANPHDGSSRHSNIGLSFTGPAVTSLLESEKAILALSGAETGIVERMIDNSSRSENFAASPTADTLQVVTESAILSSALDIIESAISGDQIDMAVFYLSHRRIINALAEARQRGVQIRVLLDANNDAFGHAKNGIPNRPVAAELVRSDIPVRWCHTRGEQCHSKLLIKRNGANAVDVLLGSANFTRRNLNDLNLETSVHLRSKASSPVVKKAVRFFETCWYQGPDSNAVMSLPYETWADESTFKYWRYRLMEASGLSTF
ncbi:MAG: phospholipase D-like domain-containing protein [Marinobacter sp.]|nr:phospholipase D-like domain-containing protein [Marinobacter sp.]